MILNNIKALGIHIFIVIITVFLFSRLPMDWVMTAILCDALYVVIGYAVLRPVDKYEFASTMPVLVLVLIELIIAFPIYGEGDQWWTYVMFNPSGNTLSILFQVMFQSEYGRLASVVVPSLLMYAGLRIKRRRISCRKSKEEAI